MVLIAAAAQTRSISPMPVYSPREYPRQVAACRYEATASPGPVYCPSPAGQLGPGKLDISNLIRTELAAQALNIEESFVAELAEIGDFGEPAQELAYAERIMPRLVGFLKDSGRPLSKIERLRNVLSFFDQAHDFLPANSQISRHVHSLTRFDLLDGLRLPIAFAALTDENYNRILYVLSKKAKFLCLLTTMALADDIYYSRHLDDLSRNYSEGDLIYEINQSVAEATDLYYDEVCARPDDRPSTAEDKYEVLFRRQINTVKSFNYIWMARLYLRLTSDPYFASYLSVLPDRGQAGTLSARRASVRLRSIFKEKAALSEAVLKSVYHYALRHMQRQYGSLDGKFSILIAGANARKEFPSFDYDCLLVYEPGQQAVSRGGYQGRLRASDYYRRLAQTVQISLGQMDMELDLNYQLEYPYLCFGTGPQDVRNGEVILATLQDYRVQLSARGKDAYQEIVFLGSLRYGAGDRVLAQQLKDAIDDLRQKTDPLKVKAERYLSRQVRLAEKDAKNIKNCPGGLREFHELIWFADVETDYIPQMLTELFPDPEECRQMVAGYLFVMSLRIFLDFYYGRNDKTLPSDLGSLLSAYGIDPAAFRRAMKKHQGNISRLSEKYYQRQLQSDPRLAGAIEALLEEYRAQQEIEWNLDEMSQRPH